MSGALSPTAPSGPSNSARTPHRPPPPVTSKRLGALGNVEDKAQSARNTLLSAKSIETGDSVVSLHDSNLINVSSKIAQLTSKLEANLNAVVSCEDGFVWSQPCNWDFEMLINRFEFTLKVPEIAALIAVGDYQPAETRFTLQELATTELSRGRLAVRRGDLKLTDKHADQPVSDVTIALYEYLHADVLGHAREELSRTEAGIQRLLKSIEHHRTSKNECLAATDTATAESHHRGMVDDYVELLEILNARLSQLALSTNDTSSFRGQAQAALDAAKNAYDTFNTLASRLQDDVTADLAKSEEVRVTEQRRHKEACQTHAAYTKTTQQALQDNAATQLNLFNQIKALAEQMKTLSEERLALLHESVEEKRAEELRIANYNEFTQVHADHLAHLQKLKDLSDSYCLATAGLLDYHAIMSDKIAKKDVEGQLAQLTLEEAQRYLEHYRGMIFTTGELVTAKELRVETLQRQRRLSQLQQDTALDLLDPEAHLYVAKQQTLNDKMLECQAAVVALKELMDQATQDFEPAQEILFKQRIEFEHPVAKRTEMAAAEKQRYVDRTLNYVSSEETAIESHRDHLRKLKHVVDSERQQTQAAAKRARLPSTNPTASTIAAGPAADDEARQEDPAATQPQHVEE